MNTNVNLVLKFLVAAAAVVSFGGALYAADGGGADGYSLDRSTIAHLGDGNKSIWIQREYAGEISLGVDPETGARIYPHRSVRVLYSVDCAKGKLNMTAWKLFSQPGGQGAVVWMDQLEGPLAERRYVPRSEEERSVVGEVCDNNLAGF